jgi:hypothetical protein
MPATVDRADASMLALTNRMLRGAGDVARQVLPGRPELFVFEVDRGSRGPLVVAWKRRDDLTGEDLPPTAFEREWPHSEATAVTAYGETVQTQIADGRVRLGLDLALVFLTDDSASASHSSSSLYEATIEDRPICGGLPSTAGAEPAGTCMSGATPALPTSPRQAPRCRPTPAPRSDAGWRSAAPPACR